MLFSYSLRELDCHHSCWSRVKVVLKKRTMEYKSAVPFMHISTPTLTGGHISNSMTPTHLLPFSRLELKDRVPAFAFPKLGA